ncbi:MAG TPA: type IV pilin [Candidatus Thermoplasmatota archaeon]|nr:type IV pilin [Candidatus Thermoplasmatota archaeon]
MIGTVLLLGATVTLVAVAAWQLHALTAEASREPPPAVELAASLSENRSTVLLLHRGGPALDTSGLTVQVDLDGVRLQTAPLRVPGSALWRLGDRVSIHLSQPLQAGDHLDVTVVSRAHAAVVAEASLDVPLAQGLGPAATDRFNVTAYFADGKDLAVVNTSTTLQLFAQTHHPLGRKFVKQVVVDLTPLSGPSYVLLLDDGTEGDLRGGDGIYARTFVVPSFVPLGLKTLTVRAEDFNGSITSGFVSVSVVRSLTPEPERLLFNTSIFSEVAFWTNKTGSQSNSVAVTLRARLADDKGVVISGRTYYPKLATFYYVPFKPGDTGVVPAIRYACANTVTKPIAPEWVWGDISIPNYDRSRNLLQYYFTITLETKDSPVVQRTVAIQSNTDTQYFTMKSTEVRKLVESASGAFGAIGPCR